ncbi:hypothetical protein HRbin30_02442 [bacterium HR30]|nr:hypothetical protein HRbin30_02442 [bacterium HR30]
MAASDRHTERTRCIVYVAHDASRGRQRTTRRQKQRHLKPRRPAPKHRDIVGIHMHGIPARFFAHEGDGVALQHQNPLAQVHHRRIAPKAGTEKDTMVRCPAVPE